MDELFSAPLAGAKPARIAANLTVQENACVAVHLLPAGTYYAVVRGTTFAGCRVFPLAYRKVLGDRLKLGYVVCGALRLSIRSLLR